MGLIEGLLNLAAWLGFDRAINAFDSPEAADRHRREETARAQSITGRQLLKPEMLTDDVRADYQRMLRDRINERGQILTQLYHAIDWQPVDKNLAAASQEPGIIAVGPHFTNSYPLAGMHDLRLELIGTWLSVHGLSPTMSYDDSATMREIRDSLQIVRERYWIPNKAHHDIWLHIRLGDLYDYLTETPRQRAEYAQGPFDVSCDIVERSRDEIDFFDHVQTHILRLSSRMILDAATWDELEQRKTLSGPCVRNLGFMNGLEHAYTLRRDAMGDGYTAYMDTADYTDDELNEIGQILATRPARKFRPRSQEAHDRNKMFLQRSREKYREYWGELAQV